MTKTLVTGATGLVGYNIVQALLREGRQVRALVRSIDKGRRILPNETELHQGDVTVEESVRSAMQGCDVVYHAAGLPEQWLPDPGMFRTINVEGTQNMINAALKRKIAVFIYISTVDVFAADAGEEYDETKLDPELKHTAYERSKQEADRRVVAALREKLPAIFIHPAAVYGPGPAGSPGLNEFVRRLADGEVPMVPPGIIPVVFSEDLATGCLLAERSAVAGERFILSESCLEFQEIARVIGQELMINKVPKVMPLWLAKSVAAAGEWVSQVSKRPPLIHRGQLDLLQWKALPLSVKARRELDWRPIPFREGIKRTIASLFGHRP